MTNTDNKVVTPNQPAQNPSLYNKTGLDHHVPMEEKIIPTTAQGVIPTNTIPMKKEEQNSDEAIKPDSLKDPRKPMQEEDSNDTDENTTPDIDEENPEGKIDKREHITTESNQANTPNNTTDNH